MSWETSLKIGLLLFTVLRQSDQLQSPRILIFQFLIFNHKTKNKMAKANTNSSVADFSIRDVIRTAKKNAKAVKTLKGIGGNKPGIKEAIDAITAENEKLTNYA